jgi:uncharacterized protein YjbJ (UPF0337 family)
MNQEQFGQFWPELKAPLQAKWGKITDEDLLEIQGNLATFGSILRKRYGEVQKDQVTTWANRRYAHWTGNYAGYQDATPAY